jgi:hypothetical protein
MIYFTIYLLLKEKTECLECDTDDPKTTGPADGTAAGVTVTASVAAGTGWVTAT